MAKDVESGESKEKSFSLEELISQDISLQDRLEMAFNEPPYQRVRRKLDYFIYSNAKDIFNYVVNRDDFQFDVNHINKKGMAYFASQFLFDVYNLESVDTGIEDELQMDMCSNFCSHFDVDDQTISMGDEWSLVNGEGFREFYHSFLEYCFNKEDDFYIDMILTCSLTDDLDDRSRMNIYDSFFSKHKERISLAQTVKGCMVNDKLGIPHDDSKDKSVSGLRDKFMPDFEVYCEDDMLYLDVCVMNKRGIHARPSTDIISLKKKYDLELYFSIDDNLLEINNVLDILQLGLNPGTYLRVAVPVDEDPTKANDLLRNLHGIFSKTLDEYDSENKEVA